MFATTTRKITTICSVTIFIALGGNATAQSQPVGVLGLYDTKDPQSINLDATQFDGLDCTLRYSGIIVAEQGDINLQQPNQFVLLACDSAVMANISDREKLEALTGSEKAIALMEGDLTDFIDATSGDTISDRQYILKISHYNNIDVTGRDADLIPLTKKANESPDAYITESFIGVNTAVGMATPDEVVVLYYDNAASADRFRNNNGELLTEITSYNQKHLIDSVYYIGQVQ